MAMDAKNKKALAILAVLALAGVTVSLAFANKEGQTTITLRANATGPNIF